MRRLGKRIFVVVAIAVIVPRVLVPVIAVPTAVGTYRLLNDIGLDDELPSESMSIAAALFWPFDKRAQIEIWRESISGDRPNDLLVFATSQQLARRVRRAEARQLFVDHARALQQGPCERRYLLAAILPLGEKGTVAPTKSMSVLDAYQAVGRDMQQRGVLPETDCAVYTNALGRYLAKITNESVPRT